jgi:hypothetical protein
MRARKLNFLFFDRLGRKGGVPVGAVARDGGDAGAIHLRDRVGQAASHYAWDI